MEATVKFFNPHQDEIAYNGTLNIQPCHKTAIHEEDSDDISLQNRFTVVFQLQPD